MHAPAQALVATHYRLRTAAFLYCFAVVGLVLSERGASPLGWALLAIQFLVYPHFVYWRARLSEQPRRAELQNLLLDALLLGAWCAELGFPTWISYALIAAPALNALVNRGAQGLAKSLLCSAAGASLWALLRGAHYTPATSELVTALCVVGVFVYSSGVGYVVYRQNRRLAAARDELRRNEALYRLIAENAGDLIALVDPVGTWIYTSPSYQRILAPEDLRPGVEAYRRLHPDDADKLRSAIVRTSLMGRTREVSFRLVDKQGRVLQYKTRIQPLLHHGDAPRILLVSRDVTDLRESEERLLLAAHALEGMTEAIVITSADGTVVTVNRAFCELTGWTRDDVLGQSEKAIRNALQPGAYYDELYATVLREGYWSGTTWAKRRNGVVYREWRSVRAVRDLNGAITHYVMVVSEVGKQKAAIDASNPGLNPGLRG